ncbi:hypothetical protein [Alkalicoccobacillus plakortidis]|uniref:Uncharacterized protein n=1 Tax=Alkalicoccobacillus plakortidis TaxID=444060 RepID=A0ABT0XKE6_9BACI|nr:hypothetical protein [Alkalicoccobacillus plakortidis]MCM2676382.1 hypothetical protein [Alkalicoccobacillus plakortidis]
MSFLNRKSRHLQFQKVLAGMVVFPVIAILGFLNVIPVSTSLAWVAFVAFIVCLLVFIISFNGKAPVDEK